MDAYHSLNQRIRLKKHILKCAKVGLALGVTNSVVIGAITGMLSAKNIGFLLLGAVLASLLFAAIFFIATNDWDEFRILIRRRRKRVAPAPVKRAAGRTAAAQPERAPEPSFVPVELTTRNATRS